MSTEKTPATLRAELLELGHSLAAQARAALSLKQTAENGAYIQHLTDAAAKALREASEADKRAKQEDAIDRLVKIFGPLAEQYLRPSGSPGPRSVS